MRSFERLTDMAPGKGGMTAGFFQGKTPRQIRVHSVQGKTCPGTLRRGLRVFAVAALLTGALFTGWAGAAHAAAPADQNVAEASQSTNFNSRAVKDVTAKEVATDLNVTGGFARGEALIRSAAADKQYLLFGDTNHGHAELRQFMALPGTFDALSAAGVKKIVLEMPDALQGAAERFGRGDMSRATFIRTLEQQAQILLRERVEGLQARVFNSVADMIEHARDHDMSVHFINVLEMPESIEDMAVSAEKAWKKHARVNSLDRDDFPAMVAFMTDFIQNKGENAMSDLFDDIMLKRLEDERRAKAIENVAGRDKTAVFYGSGHFSNVALGDKPRPRDMDEYLGAEKTVVINLHRDQQALQDYIAAGLAGPDLPDHVYVLAGDTVLPGQAAAMPVQAAKQTQPQR